MAFSWKTCTTDFHPNHSPPRGAETRIFKHGGCLVCIMKIIDEIFSPPKQYLHEETIALRCSSSGEHSRRCVTVVRESINIYGMLGFISYYFRTFRGIDPPSNNSYNDTGTNTHATNVLTSQSLLARPSPQKPIFDSGGGSPHGAAFKRFYAGGISNGLWDS